MARPRAGPHRGVMTTSDGTVRVWFAVLGSLVPWAALLMTIALAEASVGIGDLGGAAVFSLAFVALPSAVAIAAGRTRATQVAVALVMAGVAVFAGVQVATIDDGQAGLAVFYVPMVAFPLAGVVRAGQRFDERLRSGRAGS
jgi:hypothetical protein